MRLARGDWLGTTEHDRSINLPSNGRLAAPGIAAQPAHPVLGGITSGLVIGRVRNGNIHVVIRHAAVLNWIDLVAGKGRETLPGIFAFCFTKF